MQVAAIIKATVFQTNYHVFFLVIAKKIKLMFPLSNYLRASAPTQLRIVLASNYQYQTKTTFQIYIVGPRVSWSFSSVLFYLSGDFMSWIMNYCLDNSPRLLSGIILVNFDPIPKLHFIFDYSLLNSKFFLDQIILEFYIFESQLPRNLNTCWNF